MDNDPQFFGFAVSPSEGSGETVEVDSTIGE
jgi:hypothetical protein